MQTEHFSATRIPLTTRRQTIGALLALGAAASTTVADAQRSAYQALDAVKWENGFCRRDIGWRAVAREKA